MREVRRIREEDVPRLLEISAVELGSDYLPRRISWRRSKPATASATSLRTTAIPSDSQSASFSAPRRRAHSWACLTVLRGNWCFLRRR